MSKFQKHDEKLLKSIYDTICICEDLKPIKIYFGSAGRGGAKCSYRGNRPLYITIDLTRIQCGSVYALCHEVAHQMEIIRGNATHNRAFKKVEAYLVKKYSNSIEARQLYW